VGNMDWGPNWSDFKPRFFLLCVERLLLLCNSLFVFRQGITNTLALAIDKMLYIYLLCPHSEHPKKICSNLNSLNTFTKETGSGNVKPVLIKVKLPKVGSNAIVLVLHRDKAQQIH
jgi:hypothetical protein